MRVTLISMPGGMEWLLILIAMIWVPGAILFLCAKYIGKIARATIMNSTIVAFISIIGNSAITYLLIGTGLLSTASTFFYSSFIEFGSFAILSVLIGKLIWRSDFKSTIKSVMPLLLIFLVLTCFLYMLYSNMP